MPCIYNEQPICCWTRDYHIIANFCTRGTSLPREHQQRRVRVLTGPQRRKRCTLTTRGSPLVVVFLDWCMSRRHCGQFLTTTLFPPCLLPLSFASRCVSWTPSANKNECAKRTVLLQRGNNQESQQKQPVSVAYFLDALCINTRECAG